jgi:LmbE family N-acetylglucosaminyl deacetylase
MSSRRILISMAHPDDESFGLGGLIARYVDEGAEVYLICATNGDVGTVPDDLKSRYDNIADLRLAELDCAAEILGFKEVFKFGYKDSGMIETEANKDPDCLWYTWEHTPDAVIERVVDVIRQVQPHVVITFNRYGGYGHPDHIAIQRATTQAFHLASDPDYLPGGLPAYTPQKLYYHGISAFFIRLGVLMMRLRGKDPRKVGVNEDIDLVKILDYVEPAHTHIDVKNYLKTWEKANACHASQGGGRRSFIPRVIRRLLGGEQKLTRIYPKPVYDRIDEHDVFNNVKFERPMADYEMR